MDSQVNKTTRVGNRQAAGARRKVPRSIAARTLQNLQLTRSAGRGYHETDERLTRPAAGHTVTESAIQIRFDWQRHKKGHKHDPTSTPVSPNRYLPPARPGNAEFFY